MQPASVIEDTWKVLSESIALAAINSNAATNPNTATWMSARDALQANLLHPNKYYWPSRMASVIKVRRLHLLLVFDDNLFCAFG
jgi:hypothetical protein